MQLPIPVQWYEQQAFLMGNRQTLKKLISGIGHGGGGTLNYEIAPLLQSLRGQLDLLYNRLAIVNPKSEAFLASYRERVRPLVAQKKTAALLVRNDVVARAMWPWLQSEGEPLDDDHVRVVTYRQIDSRELYDYMLALAWWPTRYRWQIGGRLARHMDFLLYRGEEVILERQMSSFYSPLYRQSCARRRFETLHAFKDIVTVPAARERLEERSSRASLFDLQPRLLGGIDLLPEETLEDVEPEVRSLFEITTLDLSNFTDLSHITQMPVPISTSPYAPRVGDEAVDENDDAFAADDIAAASRSLSAY